MENFQNLAKVERYAQNSSVDMGIALKVYTGSYGFLKKPYLHPSVDVGVTLNVGADGIEVPLIVWKLLIHPESNSAVSFFLSNKASMSADEKRLFPTICNSVCGQLGDEIQTNSEIVCCTYEDFKKHITFLPEEIGLRSHPNLLKNTALLAKEMAEDAKVTTTKQTHPSGVSDRKQHTSSEDEKAALKMQAAAVIQLGKSVKSTNKPFSFLPLNFLNRITSLFTWNKNKPSTRAEHPTSTETKSTEIKPKLIKSAKTKP